MLTIAQATSVAASELPGDRVELVSQSGRYAAFTVAHDEEWDNAPMVLVDRSDGTAQVGNPMRFFDVLDTMTPVG